MTPEEKHRLIIEMDTAAENASNEGGNDFERMKAALSVAEKAIRDDVLDEVAVEVYSSDPEAPEPTRPYDTWGDMVADTPERHAGLCFDHDRWELANTIRAMKELTVKGE